MTLLSRWRYKWLLVLNDTTVYARHFVSNTPRMCPKRDVGKVVTAKSWGAWACTTCTGSGAPQWSTFQSMLRKQLLQTTEAVPFFPLTTHAHSKGAI